MCQKKAIDVIVYYLTGNDIITSKKKKFKDFTRIQRLC